MDFLFSFFDIFLIEFLKKIYEFFITSKRQIPWEYMWKYVQGKKRENSFCGETWLSLQNV